MRSKKELSVFGLMVLVGMSCAKEKSYDEAYRTPQLEAKSSIKISKTVIDKSGKKKIVPVKYLYVPMTLGTPREVKQANPFYQGDEKIVRLKWAKEGLKVLQMELDDRYADNELNEVPVMTIPGDYKDFKCKEDAYDNCTNAEVENKETTWDNKKFFDPKFAEIKVEELNMLDLANVEGDSCVTLQATSLVDYELSDGVVNIELEKTYKLKNSWKCIRSNYYDDKLAYNSFKVRFFYSLVELDQLATKGYETVNYPVTDQDKFGFFKDEKEVLEDEFDRQRKKDQVFLSRWSPKRKNNKLTYYLSKTFNKTKNKALLKATYKALKIMNMGLRAAKVPFELEMIQQEDDAKEISPGDLRYNTLVLIDDPLANGLLGYGPTVTNPLTGEIVQGHVNMYGGVLTSTVRRVYDSAVDLSIKKLQEAKDKVSGSKSIKLEGITLAKGVIKTVPTALIDNVAKSTQAVVTPINNSSSLNIPEYSYEVGQFDLESFKVNEASKTVDPKRALKNLMDSNFEGMDELEKRAKLHTAQERGLLLDTEHSPEFFEVGGTVKSIPEDMLKIKGITNSDGSLKRWKRLSKSQKKKVKNIILVESYISTLVHEFGHNLGLRHNFSGSFDKENFYTDKEAKKLGMKTAPAYSSVMDYSYSNFNELAAFGKYDVAALRFGYAREVKTESGQFAKVRTTYTDLAKKKKLKTYAFCTDENATLNTSCNRFDEGTTLVEIVKHKIERYKDGYKYRNFRDGRKSFSTYGLVDYLIRRYNEFASIRDIVEDYERFVQLLGPGIMDSGCSKEQSENPNNKEICAMIKDRIDSTQLIGDFFIEILKTPDHTCAIAKAEEPTKIVKLEKLSDIYEGVKRSAKNLVVSCFDPAVKAKFMAEKMVVVGENGKYLNSVGAKDPKNKYASDRDVRGVWIDKVLAMRQIFSRTSSRTATDSGNMALIDVSSIRSKLVPLIAHLTLGEKLTEPLPFKTEDKKEFTIPYVIGSDYKIDQIEGYFFWIKQFFKMPRNGKASLVKTTLAQITKEGLSFGDETIDKAYAYTNFATVKKLPYYQPRKEHGHTNYFTTKNYSYGAGEENYFARHIIDTLNGAKFLSSVKEETILKILKQKTNPDAPEELELDANLKAFFSLDSTNQEAIVGYRAKNTPIPDETFVSIFGKELGTKLAAAYKLEANVLGMLVTLKKSIMSTPAKDATENELKLFKISTKILDMQIKGSINAELLEFYKGQLKKFPKHVNNTNV